MYKRQARTGDQFLLGLLRFLQHLAADRRQRYAVIGNEIRFVDTLDQLLGQVLDRCQLIHFVSADQGDRLARAAGAAGTADAMYVCLLYTSGA